MSAKVRTGLSYVCIVALGMAVSLLLIVLVGSDVGKAAGGFFAGVFGSPYAISEVLAKATPLVLAGLGISVAFRSGFVNIGAEGQLYMGAIACTAVGMYFPNLPRAVMLPLCLLCGFAASGVWALIPGVLKARFGVSEVINTIMFNYIALGLTGVLLQTVLKDPSGHFPMSPQLPAAAHLSVLIKGARLHTGALIALVCAALVWVFVFKTPAGYRMRAVGLNKRACECSGIPVGRSILMSSLISGGLAGIAGVCEIAGLHHKLLEGISPSYGYLAIIVALLGGNHPLGVVLSAVGIAALQVGSLSMQRAAAVPSAIASIIMGAVVMLIMARKTLFGVFLRQGEAKA